MPQEYQDIHGSGIQTGESVSEVHLCHWNYVYKISNVYTL